MRVYGVIGWKNSGKTSLMERLVAEITGRGFTVSTVKHVHHDVDLDQPGKDTWRHRAAGASEVVLASRQRYAILHEHRAGEPELAEVLARLKPVDLVLVEGYKRDAHPKVEVWRRETGHELIQTCDALVRAVATDEALDLPVPVLDLNDTGAVADFILAEVGLAAQRFDTVVVVDWSAASVPSPAKPSADAVWMGVAGTGGERVAYFRTRGSAEAALVEVLAAERAAGRRVLVGFDFALGYPAGFAERLTGRAEARAVWAWLAERITDGADNRNNRFAVAEAVNRAFGGAGPFWGRPAGLDLAALPATKAVDYAALGLDERRMVERAVPRAQPVWKLFTTGSVGSQVLTGLPMVHRLARLSGVRVWPFDRAHEVAGAGVVLAEIYPSLLAPAVVEAMRGTSEIKDAVQVRLLARALWRLSRDGRMGELMRRPDGLPAEEGWILGAGFEDVLAEAVGMA